MKHLPSVLVAVCTLPLLACGQKPADKLPPAPASSGPVATAVEKPAPLEPLGETLTDKNKAAVETLREAFTVLNAYAEKQRVTGPSPLMKEMAAGFLAIKTTDLPGDLAAAVDSSKPGFAKLASLAAGFPDGMPADPQGMMAYSAAHPEMGAQLATVLLNLSKEMLTIHPMMEHLKKTAHKYGIEMRE